MVVNSNSEDSRILRQLYPLASFPSDAFKELCTNITVEQVQDTAIFTRGDTNTDLVYLLSGSVSLQADGLTVEVISSENESSKFALAHQIPRKIDAVANGLVRIVRLDAHTINNPPLTSYEQGQGYTVIDESFEDTDDWMTAVLRLPLFQSLPPASLQKILISLKKNHYSAGDTLVAEGDAVDYFQIIQKGHCLLTRRTADELYELKLTKDESFGEEYLVSGLTAKDTVTALTEVSVIQLEKKLFLSQILAPLVNFVSQEELPDALTNGSVLLDVRMKHQFESQNLEESANIPLMSLRMRLAEIPNNKQIIVVCANGKASEAAAFLLIKNKLNAKVLKGGAGFEEDDTEKLEAEPITAGLDSQFEDSQTESEKLKQKNQELEAKIVLLQAEKDQAVERNLVLAQQLERLKEILARLTKNK
jgi:CRP-like cAMP-binding protein